MSKLSRDFKNAMFKFKSKLSREFEEAGGFRAIASLTVFMSGIAVAGTCYLSIASLPATAPIAVPFLLMYGGGTAGALISGMGLKIGKSRPKI